MKKILVLLCPILMLTACVKKDFVVQGSSPLSKEKVSQILGGFTNETELVNLLGEPISKIAINKKETLWTYEYTNKSSVSNILIYESNYMIEKRKLDVIVSKGLVIRFNYEEDINQKKW